MQTQIIKLYEKTWAVEDGGVRIFVLAGNAKALVIDTGMSGLPVRQMAEELTGLPVLLLNTHADPDHIGGNDAFDTFFMHPSEAIIYHNMHHRGGKMLPVFDGDRIDLGGRFPEVVHVPGHTPGSITVLDREARCLIGGDPVQEDGDIFMFGMHRDMEAYIAGLQHLMRKDEAGEIAFDFIFPSHAKLKVDKSVIPQLIAGAEKILAGELQGTEVEMHGRKVCRIDGGVSRFLCEPVCDR